MNELHHTHQISGFWYSLVPCARNLGTLDLGTLESSVLACFGLSLLIFMNGRSLPVLFDFIHSASAWFTLLKSSSSSKSLIVMLIDHPLNTKNLFFEASAE